MTRYSGTRRGIGALQAPGGVGAILRHQEGIRGVGVYWGLAVTLGTQGPEGV